MELCDTFKNYSKTQQAAICLSLISAAMVLVTLGLRMFGKTMFGNYHIILYVLLLGANAMILSMFVKGDDAKGTKELKSYTSFQEEAICLNIIVCVVLLVLLIARAVASKQKIVIKAPSVTENTKAVLGLGAYEHSTLHSLLYVFILIANLFSISFFTCK